LGAEQTLLLAAPERDADGPARLHPERLENPGRLHHHRASNRVVGRPGRGVPGVEVATEHDHLVPFVGSGNLRDGVERRPPFRIQPVDDREFELDGDAVGKNPRDAAEILVAEYDRGDGLRGIERRVVERANLPVIAPGIVQAQHGTA
jgi:hypothetical protein